MKTADFFNLFKHHQLGKKRNFGAYRVIDGDTCQVLVRASTRFNVPNGSELIAITFSPTITLWHATNLRNVKHTVRDEINGKVLSICSDVMDDQADNLLDSGIIDIDETNKKMLIEIGDTPWLLENEECIEDEYWTWTYNIATKLGVRCASVAEAVLDTKPQPNTISALGWTMERMPVSFVPDGISHEDRATLTAGMPNPMNFGFQVEHCKRETTYTRGSLGGDLLFLMSEHANTSDGQRYKVACDAWDEAINRYDNMKPNRYENISTNGGELVLVDQQLYLKGEVRQVFASSNHANLAGWHKLLNKSSKIRLKA